MLVEQILSGLATGSVYAILALSLVMIYNSTGHINFAQGEMAMFSAYLALSMVTSGVPYWLAFFATIMLSFLGGAVLERVVFRPLANAPVLAIVVSFIGLFLAVNAIAGWLWGYHVQEFPSPVAGSQHQSFVRAHNIFIMAVTVGLIALLFVFFRFTPIGLAMRAAAENPASAKLVGIRVSWMMTLGWGLASGIGAVAGMLIAPVVFLEPTMMLGILLYSFAGALLGGLSSPFGAVVGGLMFGVIENIAGAYLIGSQLKFGFALLVVIVVVTLKPNGLFGKTVQKRV